MHKFKVTKQEKEALDILAPLEQQRQETLASVRQSLEKAVKVGKLPKRVQNMLLNSKVVVRFRPLVTEAGREITSETHVVANISLDIDKTVLDRVGELGVDCAEGTYCPCVKHLIF